ncbi:MAG: hypothetical protein EBY65_07155 [Acidimicrobiia bacterium]|nr:hypothetical protein [Acidimicrobiia bacterium]
MTTPERPVAYGLTQGAVPMNQITCHEHHVATMADACARVTARSYGGAWLGSFLFVTKPYADQRPTGAPPG